VTVLNIVYNTC